MHFAMPCLITSDMHHTCLCIMPCVCGGCLLCCLFLSGLLLSLASVSFRSCEDSFDYMRLSSSWTRSSSLRDLTQDDHYPRYHFYLCLLVARSFAMPMLRYLSLALQASQIAMYASNLFTLPSKTLFGYVTALLSPSYSVVSCRWSWSLFHVGTWICWDITIYLI